MIFSFVGDQSLQIRWDTSPSSLEHCPCNIVIESSKTLADLTSLVDLTSSVVFNKNTQETCLSTTNLAEKPTSHVALTIFVPYLWSSQFSERNVSTVWAELGRSMSNFGISKYKELVCEGLLEPAPTMWRGSLVLLLIHIIDCQELASPGQFLPCKPWILILCTTTLSIRYFISTSKIRSQGTGAAQATDCRGQQSSI